MNYTKGEWVAKGSAIDCNGWPVAQTYPDTRLSSEASLALMHGNAHLTAAAPDMYEALQYLRIVFQDAKVRVSAEALPNQIAVESVFERVDKALAKAEGREK